MTDKSSLKKIFTNEIVLEFNDTNIERDFDIFGISFKSQDNEQKKYISSRMLDFTDMDYKAMSILYIYGTYMYCLFRAGAVTKEELKNRIQEKTGAEVEIYLTDSRQMRPEHLAQLLCNSLIVFGDDRKFHNLLGKLLYLSDSSFSGKPDINSITAACISISSVEKLKKKYRLECSALPFHSQELLLQYAHKKEDREKILSAPKFVLDDEYNLRKMTDSVRTYSGREIFIQKSLGSPASIPFTDLRSAEHFTGSKTGIIHQFLNDVKEFLGDYLSIRLRTVNNVKTRKSSSSNLLFRTEKEYFREAQQKGINLVNYATDEVISYNLKERLVQTFNHLGVSNITQSDMIQEEFFNLVLIHEPDYYRKKQIEDIHQNSFYTQHIIIENTFSRKTGELKDVTAIVRKCIFELMIKQDLMNGKLALYKENLDSPVHYAEIRTYTDEKGKKHKKFYILTIDEGNNLKFEVANENTNIEKYKTLISYTDIFSSHYNRPYDLKYIIYTDDDVILLMDNNIMTMPDLDELYLRVMNYSKDKTLARRDLIAYYKEFRELYPEYEKDVDLCLDAISRTKKEEFTYEEITNNQKASRKDRVIPIMPLSGSMAHDFVAFLRNRYGIIINMVLRDKQSSSVINNQMTKINVFNNEYDNLDDTIYYYVGSRQPLKAVNGGVKVEKAVHIKGLISLKSKKELSERLIQQLDVDFVRLGEYTVYPFPVKYLHEYILLHNESENI